MSNDNNDLQHARVVEVLDRPTREEIAAVSDSIKTKFAIRGFPEANVRVTITEMKNGMVKVDAVGWFNVK